MICGQTGWSTGGAPFGGDFWRVEQGLEDYAILLGFFLERTQLIGSGLGRGEVELDTDGVEADGNVF